MSRWGTVKLFLVGALMPVLMFSVLGLLMPSEMSNALDWLLNPDSTTRVKNTQSDYEIDRDKFIEMTLEKVVIGTAETGPVVLLKEKNGKRYIPVSVGMSEARAIATALQGTKPARPLTHDLLRGVIAALGARVQFIIIEDLRDGIYYAKVILSDNGKTISLDSRPSDAMALALRSGAPVYASEKLLENTPSPGEIKTRADM
ncbi:MAG: bifunctional nuclease family protein [Dehalococcoidia bacterium]|nr:bifunctional nuclease family protein [Dehalococcoidia bacterium]